MPFGDKGQLGACQVIFGLYSARLWCCAFDRTLSLYSTTNLRNVTPVLPLLYSASNIGCNPNLSLCCDDRRRYDELETVVKHRISG